MSYPIITLPTGYFKPGIKGTAVFDRHKTVFLGEAYLRTEIPTYLVQLEGSPAQKADCQAGRDFEFIKAP